jgi:hypothetical protein
MLQDILEFIKTREEVVAWAGRKVVVRELSAAADLGVDPEKGKANPQEIYWRMVVRSVFTESGDPVFTDEDIPALRAASQRKLEDLLVAVNKVNGQDLAAEVKNSDAVPA